MLQFALQNSYFQIILISISCEYYIDLQDKINLIKELK